MDNAQPMKLIVNNNINQSLCNSNIINADDASIGDKSMTDEHSKCVGSVRDLSVSVPGDTQFRSSTIFFSDNATQTNSRFARNLVSMHSTEYNLKNLGSVSAAHSIEHMPHSIDLKNMKSTFIVISDNVRAQRHSIKVNNSLCHFATSIPSLRARRARVKDEKFHLSVNASVQPETFSPDSKISIRTPSITRNLHKDQLMFDSQFASAVLCSSARFVDCSRSMFCYRSQR